MERSGYRYTTSYIPEGNEWESDGRRYSHCIEGSVVAGSKVEAQIGYEFKKTNKRAIHFQTTFASTCGEVVALRTWRLWKHIRGRCRQNSHFM